MRRERERGGQTPAVGSVCWAKADGMMMGCFEGGLSLVGGAMYSSSV